MNLHLNLNLNFPRLPRLLGGFKFKFKCRFKGIASARALKFAGKPWMRRGLKSNRDCSGGRGRIGCPLCSTLPQIES